MATSLASSLTQLAERNYIDGQWAFTREGYAFDIYDPSCSEVIAAVPLSTHRDIRRAVEAAQRGMAAWSKAPIADRAERIARALQLLEDDIDDVASVTSRDVGIPLALARVDLRRAIDEARRHLASVKPAPSFGVVGQILSWSSPLLVSLSRLAPDLVRGHTAVVKPSLRAPLSLVCWADALERADVPAGVFNLVQGAGLDAGMALARTPGLLRLDFQGSRRIAREASLSPQRHGVEVSTVMRQVQLHRLPEDIRPELEAARLVEACFGHAARPGFGGLRVQGRPEQLDQLGEALWPHFAEAGYEPSRHSYAPLPTETARTQAEQNVAALLDRGARVVCEATPPDPRTYRMGWFVPARVLRVGEDQALDPEAPYGPLIVLGPVP